MFAREEEPGNKAVFTKFEGYRAAKRAAELGRGGKVAKVDRVEWLWIPDMQTAVNALINGEIDLIERLRTICCRFLEADESIVLDDTNLPGQSACSA